MVSSTNLGGESLGVNIKIQSCSEERLRSILSKDNIEVLKFDSKSVRLTDESFSIAGLNQFLQIAEYLREAGRENLSSKPNLKNDLGFTKFYDPELKSIVKILGNNRYEISVTLTIETPSPIFDGLNSLWNSISSKFRST